MTRKRKKSVAFDCEYPNNRCPICCIVPPHMLEHIAQHGSRTQRDWAFETLDLSAQFLGRRNVVGGITLMPQPGKKQRTVYDAKTSQDLPGTVARSEGDPPTSDDAVNEAYDGAGITYDFYSEVFERTSVDDKGLRLESTVHYGAKYDNAFWNGSQMVYGDGDGEIFQRFTKSVDVIAHELTHGVTQYEANLLYRGEAGAVNESVSDIFGSLVKQRLNKHTADQADWIIGQGLFADNIKGMGIRSMKAPGTAYDDPMLGKDPQPAHIKDIYTGTKDNGGVHINSGIPNYAFYLAAAEIGGYAWEKAGKIWYVTLHERLRSNTTFVDTANATIEIAGKLYGDNSNEQKAVQNAWQKVGVLQS